jgi:hypothetical protein
MDRRITLTAESITLEIVAQRAIEGWEFTARAYRDNQATDEFVLTAGRRRILPGAQKCFYWSARRGPKRLVLQAMHCRIEFETLLWRGVTAG